MQRAGDSRVGQLVSQAWISERGRNKKEERCELVPLLLQGVNLEAH